MSSFDLLILGAGPGGYVCAFRAAQLGLKVALVDKRPALGGTCLNVGCIPSKALLHATEHFAWAKHHATESGIKLGSVEIDVPALLRKKDTVVAKLTGGIAQLAKARKITVLTGTASFTGPKSVRVTAADGETDEVTATNIVIATGSAPVELPFLKFDGKTIVSSDDAIAFDSVPKKLVVVGGGAIGLELGSVWARLGAEVTVVEFLPKIVAAYDDDIVRNFTRLLQKQGIKIETGAKVTGYADGILTAERDGKPLELPADKVLVAVGRRPFTDGLNLTAAGVELDEKKRIKVDAHLRTSASGIWAIGDVVAGPMLAHKAEEDGVAVAEWIVGKAGHIDWDLVPAIVYTDPEIAGVGLGEDTAKAKGRDVRVGKFNFAANGRALASDAADGFVKLIADAKTDRLLGAQILGRGAGELISEVVAHMSYGGSAEDLARTIHAHPTMSEAVKEAALAVGKSALHAL
ncbi:MAG TPA: dihydrolipoyl dehydrogenase [Opitutaceae bacterium]|nr:dihydrolipoyl dehydrogenase [Opitutaceae bacterium]